MKAWARVWLPDRAKRVTPGAYRAAILLIDLDPNSKRGPTSSWHTLEEYKRNPEAFSHVQ